MIVGVRCVTNQVAQTKDAEDLSVHAHRMTREQTPHATQSTGIDQGAYNPIYWHRSVFIQHNLMA